MCPIKRTLFLNPFIVFKITFFHTNDHKFLILEFGGGVKIDACAISRYQIFVPVELRNRHAAGRRRIAGRRVNPELVTAVSYSCIPGAEIQLLSMVIAVGLGNTPDFIFKTELCPYSLHGTE